MNTTYEIHDFEPTILDLTIRRPDDVYVSISYVNGSFYSIEYSNHRDKQPILQHISQLETFLNKHPHIRDFFDRNMR